MENNAKLGSGGESNTVIDNGSRTAQESEQEHNPNLGSLTDNNGEQEEPQPPRRSSGRTPFTNLSQVDADLALARTLQEQERAYMLLRMNTVTDGSDYGSWDAGSYLHDGDGDDDFGDPDDDTDGEDDEGEDEEDNGTDEDDEGEDEEDNGTDEDDGMDAFDVHAHGADDEDDDDDDDEDEDEDTVGVELDPASFSSDEDYARALQDAEEREMAARLLALAGINDGELEDSEDQGGNSQDAWEEVDPDELSYEELIALGEVVGSESRGLSADGIASLPSAIYKTGSSQNGSNDSCVICRLDYEDGETLTVLSCKHSYHSDCINNWLKINKVCPVCSTEVSTSEHS